MKSITRAQALFSATALGLIGAPLLGDLAAAASAAPGDLQTLNAAIELERAGIAAYDAAAKTGFLSGRILTVALAFRADHIAHRDALIGAVRAGGGIPTVKTARLPVPKLTDAHDILRYAKSVEEKAASTYLSVIPDFQDRNLAQVSAAILGVETTHVALLDEALHEFPAYPGGFVK